MPMPKISAVLNNCALHAITPEIREVVQELAKSNAITSHEFHEEYEWLKQCFKKYYEFENLEWSHFAEILSSYNSFELQIILGPVLREFMAVTIDRSENKDAVSALAVIYVITPENYKTTLTTIQSDKDGRYQDLSPDEVQIFIGYYLGLAIAYKKNISEDVRCWCRVKQQIKDIVLYHVGGAEGASAGGHWERTCEDVEEEESELIAITALLGNDYALTLDGLKYLKRYVKAKKDNEDTSAINAEANQRMEEYEKHLSSLYSNNSPPKAIDSKSEDIKPRIDSIIDSFNTEDIGHHHANAKQVAEQLKADLTSTTNTLFANKSPKLYYKGYLKKVKRLIDTARPTLERDLGWGAYLNNLWIAICNTVVGVLTLGGYQGFFAYNKADAATAADNVYNSIYRSIPQ